MLEMLIRVHKEGKALAQQVRTASQVDSVYIRVADEDYTRVFRKAWVDEDASHGSLVVYGERKGITKTLARFSQRDVSSWYIEEPEGEDN
jgi:hypothetical protein